MAEASLNPDIDRLNRLELVVHGEVVAAATQAFGDGDRLRLATEIEADESLWVAVRAFGDRDGERDMTVAHSAPVFVVVEDEPWWKLEAVPELVARHRAKLQELLTEPIRPAGDLEYWETTRLLGRGMGAATPPPRTARTGGRRPLPDPPRPRRRGGYPFVMRGLTPISRSKRSSRKAAMSSGTPAASAQAGQPSQRFHHLLDDASSVGRDVERPSQTEQDPSA